MVNACYLLRAVLLTFWTRHATSGTAHSVDGTKLIMRPKG